MGGGRKETALEESKREEADRVARYVADCFINSIRIQKYLVYLNVFVGAYRRLRKVLCLMVCVLFPPWMESGVVWSLTFAFQAISFCVSADLPCSSAASALTASLACALAECRVPASSFRDRVR